jgi:hypothetical protein
MGIVTVGFFLLIRGLAGDFLSLRRCAFPWSPREEIPQSPLIHTLKRRAVPKREESPRRSGAHRYIKAPE